MLWFLLDPRHCVRHLNIPGHRMRTEERQYILCSWVKTVEWPLDLLIFCLRDYWYFPNEKFSESAHLILILFSKRSVSLPPDASCREVWHLTFSKQMTRASHLSFPTLKPEHSFYPYSTWKLVRYVTLGKPATELFTQITGRVCQHTQISYKQFMCFTAP